MWKLNRKVFKGGSSTTSTYTPTAEEKRLWGLQADYEQYVMPNAKELNDWARESIIDSYGRVNVDYGQLSDSAQSQIAQANNLVGQLMNGEMPSVFQTNMEQALQQGVNNTVGSAISALGNRGITNSSVTNTAIQGINDSVANTMAQQYTNNIGLLQGLAGQSVDQAAQGITTAAGAQEASMNPSMTMWNASMGLDQTNVGAISALGGKGTTTTTQKTSSSPLSAVVGLGSSLAAGGAFGSGGLFCFPVGTVIEAGRKDINIEDVKVGDKIVGYDENNKRHTGVEVVEVAEPRLQQIYRLITVLKDEEQSVRTTPSQPILMQDNKYKMLAHIKVGDKVKGKGEVVAVDYLGYGLVYDLRLEDNYSYMADGFIVKGMM